MLDTDEKIAKFFFAFGLLLALGAMVLGPLDINSWSIACGVTASFVALAGMFFALQSWNEPDEVPKQPCSVTVPPVSEEQPVSMAEQLDAASGTNDDTVGKTEESEPIQ